jgi:hypothetical protein
MYRHLKHAEKERSSLRTLCSWKQCKSYGYLEGGWKYQKQEPEVRKYLEAPIKNLGNGILRKILEQILGQMLEQVMEQILEQMLAKILEQILGKDIETGFWSGVRLRRSHTLCMQQRPVWSQ